MYVESQIDLSLFPQKIHRIISCFQDAADFGMNADATTVWGPEVATVLLLQFSIAGVGKNTGPQNSGHSRI